MLRRAIPCGMILIFSCFFSLHAFAYPDSLLNKSFSYQFNALNGSVQKFIDKDSVHAISEIDDLQKWANKQDDRPLSILMNVFRWKIYTYKNRKIPDIKSKSNELVEICEKNKWRALECEVIRFEAGYFTTVDKDQSAALELYTAAYGIAKDLSVTEYPMKPELYYEIGGRFYYFRDFRTAKKYYLECLETIPVSQISNLHSKLNTVALCYYYLEEYDSAAYYYKKVVESAVLTNDIFWVGFASGNLAAVYYELHQYKEAAPLFEKDFQLSFKNHEWGGAARSLSQLADVYLKLGENEKARTTAEEAYKLIAEKKLTTDIGTVKTGYPYIAAVFAANGKSSLAFKLLDSSVQAKDSFLKARNQLFLAGVQHRLEVEKHLGELSAKESELSKQKLFTNVYMGGAAVLLLLSILVLRQKRRINSEKKISDDLLRNILPSETAEELKRTGTAQAKNYNSVTVLFTDFKNFCEVSSRMSAQELVQEINYYYSEFDKIITKYNLEKIKTIGDSYMCAGGLPVESKTHGTDVIYAAIDMVNFLTTERTLREKSNRTFLEMRIGINTGPVVAGIVGIKKFTYDIWGDTVNIASRMESSGVEGRINISETTYQVIKDRFVCSCRGEVEVKNGKNMKMYFVEHAITDQLPVVGKEFSEATA
jgi:adenylate cyclase